jgi:hypothetical protein
MMPIELVKPVKPVEPVELIELVELVELVAPPVESFERIGSKEPSGPLEIDE